MTGERRTTCRYLKTHGHQCTAEAVDPAGEVLLCAEHLGAALRLVRQAEQGYASSCTPGAGQRGKGPHQ